MSAHGELFEPDRIRADMDRSEWLRSDAIFYDTLPSHDTEFCRVVNRGLHPPVDDEGYVDFYRYPPAGHGFPAVDR